MWVEFGKVIYYSYNKEKLVNFRPTGNTETEEEQNVAAGLYYKHRTRSSDAPTIETTATGSSVMVYHLERYLPVFSYRYFQTKGIDAKSNYEAFYPNSTWTGDNGFNVSNASVKEYGIIANNRGIDKEKPNIKKMCHNSKVPQS